MSAGMSACATIEIHPEPERSLADRLFELGVEFPCGGESGCGGCKIRVVSGHIPITAAMRQSLSEAELAQGWRLACCAETRESVVVEVDQWSLPVLTDERTTPLEPRDGFGAAGQAPALGEFRFGQGLPHGCRDGNVAGKDADPATAAGGLAAARKLDAQFE